MTSAFSMPYSNLDQTEEDRSIKTSFLENILRIEFGICNILKDKF